MVILQKITFANQTYQNYNCVRDPLRICEECKVLSCQEKRLIVELLFDTCEDCAKMAALPHGAFAACKMREHFNEREMLISRMGSGSDKTDTKNLITNKKLMEYSPVKYNGKLMNSIWGLYNRYSPHNIKGNEYEAAEHAAYMQQHIAVASYVIAEDLAMAFRSGKEWRFMEK